MPIAAAEPAVERHRRRFDPAAAWGVPAHVTVLYPFVPPEEVDDAVVSRLLGAVRDVPSFDCVFSRCAWFRDELLWLAPDPDEPFRALTAALWRAFLDHPPYGGAYADVVPHLTIGRATAAQLGSLQAAASEVQGHLPIRTHIRSVLLMAGSPEPDSWSVVTEFPLA